MLVPKHSFHLQQCWCSPNISFNPCNKKALTENRESCVSRVHTKRIVCHTPDDATVCCTQSIYGKCAVRMVSIIFCDHNLKPPILTNILHVMYPWDTLCGRSKRSAIECSVVLETISHCSHNWLWRGYYTWWFKGCMDKRIMWQSELVILEYTSVEKWSNFFPIKASWLWSEGINGKWEQHSQWTEVFYSRYILHVYGKGVILPM